MSFNSTASRRRFLSTVSRFAAANITAPLALNLAAITSASAQAAKDYRALVCVYLGGGNDHFNTVVPYDAASYAAYAAPRPGIALPRDGLLPLTVASNQGGRQVALNGALDDVKRLFEGNRLGIVAGAGNLIVPMAKDRIDKDPTPAQLASHNDQFRQVLSSTSGKGSSGWGGLMADALASTNGMRAAFTSVSTAGVTRFLDSPAGPFICGQRGYPQGYIDPGDLTDRAATGASKRKNLLERAVARVSEQSRDLVGFFNGNVGAADKFPQAPEYTLSKSLQTVARMIAARDAFGLRRQIFYVEMNGYDSHKDQINAHAKNMNEVNDGLMYFDAAMEQLGMRDNVTLFTFSEFGRSIVSNGDGTDHGWGSHHFVQGGAVTRGDVFGRLPDPNPASTDIYNGWLIPSIANVQMAATFGKWMGVSDTDLTAILPELKNFTARDLGFLKA